MIVDTSALISVFLHEADIPAIARALVRYGDRKMSAPNWLEANMVVDRRGYDAPVGELERLRKKFSVEIVPFTADMAALARDAFRRYGKRHHPAQLNYGDCMAYALARHTGQPLLFKGNDFAQTDIEAVPY